MKNETEETKAGICKNLLLIFMSFLLLSGSLYAQGGFTVKGVVMDPTGFPLPGANVSEKGTTKGTITDLDGNFTLSVSKKEPSWLFLSWDMKQKK